MNANFKIIPEFNEFRLLSKKGNIIPVYSEILADLETPVSTFLKLADAHPYAYLLESVEGGERWGRYSFISWNPKLYFQSKGGQYSVSRQPGKTDWKPSPDPINEIKRLMSEYNPVEVRGLPRFWGGAVGFASYDMIRFIEKLPNKPKEALNLPDSLFTLNDKLVIFDHLSHSVKIVVCVEASEKTNLKAAYAGAAAQISEIISLLRKPLRDAKRRALKHSLVESNLSEKTFKHNVDRAKEYIKKGDIIQVVLSQRFSKKTAAGAFDIYRALRLVNPSPYMYFLKMGDFEIIGSSPEILVRKEDDFAETRPIAGTRPRGKDEAEETRLSRELLADPKERAEHIMLVDLGRNDLGRVCKSASVRVPQLMTIEKYSHVIHIVSSVTGTLKPGMDSFDLFRACFPAGTVSGAPKVRAMEIIDELEPEARGPYAGAVGYFSYSGNMDMAITIRTLVLKKGVAYAQAGAGIVADSVPSKELQESKNKAAALFSAIEKAEKGLI
ncbi:MAG TPA: anthranilate synthase component I [Elusimicrobia bacterium]|nr:MAG: anthranilate synthase component I [Elusimicrobia bacterium RIFOXYA12_FULL_49_49]OGS09238.1 MAG: anthranilate synthase component I [Elusimicrobia bacterium RIFOXYA1_FULL_47_7]OGS09337.1 MAG: anthranilate synthase component I [Elusimicrobia bacterium RIFOXYB1_FULL_48_9]OGS16843.1 MAG: anthranilate synthase component I [Elusimicrobia bacterium RIFOXYA2_FULL_47_53]OGS32071.1 MAG: anthranilate synthase component I [Elusimicrobia bacterium RIFOXYB2_FULL_46_23]HBU69964.1 anthranilate synthase